MLYVHLGILVATAVVILYTDHLGLAYMRGVRATLDLKTTRTLHYVVLAGLVGMIASGLYMAYPALSALLAQPLFLIKMGFVAVLVINSFFVGSLLNVASTTPFASLTSKQKAPLLISGALSGISWLGAALAAVFLFGNIFAWLGF